MTQLEPSAAEHYAAMVDAMIGQRTRLRGPEPPGDLFDGLPPDHRLLRTDPLRKLESNLEIIASYVQPDDVIVDVGGGGGRISLPLALRCREVINVDPSKGMGSGFLANAARAGIQNVQFIAGDWLTVDPPKGTLALVNHVTYLTRDIVTFIRKLEQSGSRRVIITVNSPPPPSRQRELYELLHGEPEKEIPGHRQLMNVIWELGIQPDLLMLPSSMVQTEAFPNREAAIEASVVGFRSEQWSHWPLGQQLERRLRDVLEEGFSNLFLQQGDSYHPRWINYGREVLITWRPGRDRA